MNFRNCDFLVKLMFYWNYLLHVWYQSKAGALVSHMGLELDPYLIPVQS